jgi:hypothetical protein
MDIAITALEKRQAQLTLGTTICIVALTIMVYLMASLWNAPRSSLSVENLSVRHDGHPLAHLGRATLEPGSGVTPSEVNRLALFDDQMRLRACIEVATTGAPTITLYDEKQVPIWQAPPARLGTQNSDGTE